MNPTTIDPLDQIAAYRPTTQVFDSEWPAEERVALLARIQASPAHLRAGDSRAIRTRRHRIWPVSAALVGTAAAALLVGGLLLPPGAPGGASAAAAAALERLAVRAEATPADLVQPGQFRHLVVRESQLAQSYETQSGQSRTSESRISQSRTLESWTSYDGQIWRHDTEPDGTADYYLFPAGLDSVNDPSPRFLATLPADAAKLLSYLRTHVSGSTSQDEAVFVAVGDMLRGGFAPPTLRAAAIRVLQETPHITVEDAHDALGRAAVKITFTDQVNRPGEGQSIYFDPDTAVILEEGRGEPQTAGSSTYSAGDVVASVPADVVAKAETFNQGSCEPVAPPKSAVGGKTDPNGTSGSSQGPVSMTCVTDVPHK